MDERAYSSIDTEPDEPPLPRRNTPPPLWHRRPVQIAAAALILAAALGAYLAHQASSPGTIHIRGAINLGLTAAADPNSSSALNPIAGDSCESADGYSDISAGTTVTIGGQSGQSLAVGALGAGTETAGGYCAFPFDIAVPAGQTAYTITISHRGTQTFTADQVKDPVELTLG